MSLTASQAASALAHQARLREYHQQASLIAKLERQLADKDDEIQRTLEVPTTGEEDAEKLALMEQQKHDAEVNPRDIAAEDALDTIVRLENRVKIEQRKNTLMAKENADSKLRLAARQKVFAKAKKAADTAISVTGWNGESRSQEEQDRKADQIAEMTDLVQKLQTELRAADVIVKKKESLVAMLQREVAARKEQEERLHGLHNDIRVRSRDVEQLDQQLAVMQREDEATSTALTVARDAHDTVALDCVRQDNMFLKQQVMAKKEQRRAHDAVGKAQQDRVIALTKRMEVIAAAIRDLGVERDYNATMSRAMMPPTAAEHDPEDMERLAPGENELVPVELYELLHRDMEAMREAVSRKDIMMLEKECVVKSLWDKFQDYEQTLRLATEQQAQAKNDKVLEIQQLQAHITDQVKDRRDDIEEMLSDNVRLKAKIIKKTSGGTHAHDNWIRK